MNTNVQEGQAEFALELERQHRDLIRSAREGRFRLSHGVALIWPVLLIAMAVFRNDLPSTEELIALGAGLGLLSLVVAVEIEMSRRTRALLRLLERVSGDPR